MLDGLDLRPGVGANLVWLDLIVFINGPLEAAELIHEACMKLLETSCSEGKLITERAASI